MDRRDDFKRWIHVLGNDLGVELRLDENNICTLAYDNNKCMSLGPSESSEHHFLIASPVFMLTQDPVIDYHIYKKALRLAFMGESTCGGTLGLGNEGMLLFGYTVPYETCDEVVFNNIVNNFALACIELEQKLSEWFESAVGKKEEQIPQGGIWGFV